MKKILIILNYYYPYVSGVSEVARILAESLVQRGYSVMVLTSNHAGLPEKEIINGVKIQRAPIICKISKGTVSPQFVFLARKLSKKADIVNLHLPMIEAGLISLLNKKKLLVTYQCDIILPKNFLNHIIVKIMDISNKFCLKKAEKIIVSSNDYGEHSRIASEFKDKFVEGATPIKDYKRKEVIRSKQGKIIGFCGRLVEEKGILILIKAFEILRQEISDLYLIIGGDYKNIAGGSIYPQLLEYIDQNNIQNIEFLGKIPEEEMECFYSSLDVFVLPSINPLEAFGMVQVESMLCGTPVVSTDLYGVRTVVKRTGMGEVSEKGNPSDLARCIKLVLDNKSKYMKSRDYILSKYGTDHYISKYLQCIREIGESLL